METLLFQLERGSVDISAGALARRALYSRGTVENAVHDGKAAFRLQLRTDTVADSPLSHHRLKLT